MKNLIISTTLIFFSLYCFAQNDSRIAESQTYYLEKTGTPRKTNWESIRVTIPRNSVILKIEYLVSRDKKNWQDSPITQEGTEWCPGGWGWWKHPYYNETSAHKIIAAVFVHEKHDWGRYAKIRVTYRQGLKRDFSDKETHDKIEDFDPSNIFAKIIYYTDHCDYKVYTSKPAPFIGCSDWTYAGNITPQQDFETTIEPGETIIIRIMKGKAEVCDNRFLKQQNTLSLSQNANRPSIERYELFDFTCK